jgi:hypothetical protein
MSPHFERALKFAETSEKAGAWTLSELHRLSCEFQRTHDLAIHEAAQKAMAWAAECDGASGDGYRNLASSISDLRFEK